MLAAVRAGRGRPAQGRQDHRRAGVHRVDDADAISVDAELAEQPGSRASSDLVAPALRARPSTCPVRWRTVATVVVTGAPPVVPPLALSWALHRRAAGRDPRLPGRRTWRLPVARHWLCGLLGPGSRSSSWPPEPVGRTSRLVVEAVRLGTSVAPVRVDRPRCRRPAVATSGRRLDSRGCLPRLEPRRRSCGDRSSWGFQVVTSAASSSFQPASPCGFRRTGRRGLPPLCRRAPASTVSI